MLQKINSKLKVVTLFFISLSFLFFANFAFAITNTNSLDIEASSSQYASISDGSQTGLDLTSDFTIEAWVKLESLPSGGPNYSIVDKAPNSGGGYRLNIGGAIDSTQLHLYYWNSSDLDTQIQSLHDTFTEEDLGKWVHIAVSVDVSAKSAKMYKNGVELSTKQVGAQAATSVAGGSKSFSVGAVNVDSTPTYFVDGLIDEVRVWSDIRSESEIQDNMYADISGSSTNLEGYWQFNGDADDKTSNNNDLTLSGSPSYSVDPAHQLSCSIFGLY